MFFLLSWRTRHIQYSDYLGFQINARYEPKERISGRDELKRGDTRLGKEIGV